MRLPVLISGFAPFGGAPLNASSEVVRWLEKGLISIQHSVQHSVDLHFAPDMPVVFSCDDANGSAIVARANDLNAVLVVAIGESGGLATSEAHISAGQPALMLERYARNFGKGTDESGTRFESRVLYANAPEVLECTIPRPIWTRALESAGKDADDFFPTYASPNWEALAETAGTFICNETYYQLLRAPNPRWRAFVHIGAMREGPVLERTARAVSRLISSLVEDLIVDLGNT